MKQETCLECGSKVNKKLLLKARQKRLRKLGLPSLAKLLSFVREK